jgi:hypothetical protein
MVKEKILGMLFAISEKKTNSIIVTLFKTFIALNI